MLAHGCGLVLGVLVLFENSIVCQCTFVAWVCVACPFCALCGGCPVFGCVPVVAWLNSNDESRHLFGSVRGVWLTLF